MGPGTERERLLRLARRRAALTAKEVTNSGIHSQQLSRLVAEGLLERVARGLYSLPEQPVTENHGLAVAAKAVPKGVVCLLSALSFHGVGTQLPHEIWMAIDRRARRPKLAWPRLRVVRFSGSSRTEGVESHRVEGQAIQVFSIAKTLADCFKYRNKIGLDVALEALREAWRA
ncbi:MAG: type IV toxin-antitoxin system AbiEi family antitoxin domain-containing protein, partial [Thermoanaerobaculia bacterium]